MYKIKNSFYILICAYSFNFHNIFANKLKNSRELKVCILFHLYNLDLIDEFIERINYFIRINKDIDFFIKINIPIASNIEITKKKFLSSYTIEQSKQIFNIVLNSTPYHKFLITSENSKKLYSISNYLQIKLNISPKKMQVIFSENRGVDIGGFFLLADQMIKENLIVDFIVKIHTKTRSFKWREALLSILYLKINEKFKEIEYLYTCSLLWNWNHPLSEKFKTLHKFFEDNNLQKKNFHFSAGTCFIISYKLIDFFKKYNLINIYNTFRKGWYAEAEVSYERLFGYLGNYLNLKTEAISWGDVISKHNPLIKLKWKMNYSLSRV